MFCHMHKGDRAQWTKGGRQKKPAVRQHAIHADKKPILFFQSHGYKVNGVHWRQSRLLFSG
jgi:hypothetical protein